jgi:hypothetical protein
MQKHTANPATFAMRRAKNARQRFFAVRGWRRRTTMRVYRAKIYRVPFAVRLDKKRTAKPLPCVFLALPCGRGAWQTKSFS